MHTCAQKEQKFKAILNHIAGKGQPGLPETLGKLNKLNVKKIMGEVVGREDKRAGPAKMEVSGLPAHSHRCCHLLSTFLESPL